MQEKKEGRECSYDSKSMSECFSEISRGEHLILSVDFSVAMSISISAAIVVTSFSISPANIDVCL